MRAGDAILLSGDIGRHGMAILAQREGLAFESSIESDCAALWPAVEALLAAGIDVHCLRDLTRGGLATAVIEIAETAGLAATLDENAVAVSEPVRGACELLGLDPFYVANEGRFVAFVPAAQADRAVAVLRRFAPDGGAGRIGKVRGSPRGRGHAAQRGGRRSASSTASAANSCRGSVRNLSDAAPSRFLGKNGRAVLGRKDNPGKRPAIPARSTTALVAMSSIK